MSMTRTCDWHDGHFGCDSAAVVRIYVNAQRVYGAKDAPRPTALGPADLCVKHLQEFPVPLYEGFVRQIVERAG